MSWRDPEWLNNTGWSDCAAYIYKTDNGKQQLKTEDFEVSGKNPSNFH